MRRLRLNCFWGCLVALTATVARPAENNLPLGLPADQNAPLAIDGYRLVTLDRTKPAVFNWEGRKLTVDLPLFIYVPEKDTAAQMRDGLRAVHARLGKLAAERKPIDSAELLTLFLALDRLISANEPKVQSTVIVPRLSPVEKTEPKRPVVPLEQLVSESSQ